MRRLVTLVICLSSTPAVAASGLDPACERSGRGVTCAWSEVRTLRLPAAGGKARSPVPVCIDCDDAMLDVQLVCEVELGPGGTVSARCESAGEPAPEDAR